MNVKEGSNIKWEPSFILNHIQRSERMDQIKAKKEKIKNPMIDILGNKSYIQWSIAVQLMRMPSLMSSLAFVIVGYYATGDYMLGGIMVTVYTLCATFFAIWGGKYIDKVGLKQGLGFLMIGSALVFFILTLVTAFKMPSIFLIILAGLAGALLAGAPGGFRTLLSQVVPKKSISSAMAFDATAIEVVVVTAPIIAATVSVLWQPGITLTMGIASLISVFLAIRLIQSSNPIIVSTPKRSQIADDRPIILPQNLWSNPRYIFWLLVSIAFGQALGTAETGAFPMSKLLGGGANIAAILIGVIAVFSIISGLLYASFEQRIKYSRFTQACILLIGLVIGCIGLYLSSNWSILIGSLVLIGICTSPLMIIRTQAIEDEIPTEKKSEGFSLMTACHSIGFGLSGLFLAMLPVKGMLIAGACTGVVVLLLAPILFNKKLYAKVISNSENLNNQKIVESTE